MKLGKSFWIKLGVESLLIVFSVLLALALNEYRTANKEREATEQSLHSIREELQSNQLIVKGWLKIHRDVLKNVGEYRNKPARYDSLVQNHQFQFQQIFNQTLVPRLVRSTAWETAKNTGMLQNFDLSLAASLSEIYDIQRIGAVTTLDKLMNLIFERETHQQENVPQTLVIFEMTLEELVAQEEHLIEEYDKVLKEFGPEKRE